MSPEETDVNTTFDVIIAGAGPAGCVLANRLSKAPRTRVLLIEAGADVAAPGLEHPDVLDPFCLNASGNPEFYWPGLVAETGADRGDSSPRFLGPYIQGCGVGGASNINGMGVERGQPGDYDEWQSLGAQGWAWNDVLPYFKKIERDLDYPAASSSHGDNGPMPVRRLPRTRWAPFAASMAEAIQRRGFVFLEDYTADSRDGLSSATTNCIEDQRVSASMAYLPTDVRRRPNLSILPNARVDRILLDGRCATGVVARIGNVNRQVFGHEVIVSCGALQSPALLMRSGIGPAKVLSKNGICVVEDLPGVGRNLQNHPYIALAVYLPRKAAQASDNPCFLQNWLRFSSKHPNCDESDMHLMAFNKCAWHKLGSRVGAVTVSVFKPYSKGYLELSSADAAISPNIKFNVLTDPRDTERLVSGLRLVLELFLDRDVAKIRHEVFVANQRLVASLGSRTAWNGLRASAIASALDVGPLRRLLMKSSRISPERLLTDKKELENFVKQQVSVQYHVCGTCRMGRQDDDEAVVDSGGRVRGMERLRVADASIFPTIPRSNLQFPVLMAAEKIADMIATG